MQKNDQQQQINKQQRTKGYYLNKLKQSNIQLEAQPPTKTIRKTARMIAREARKRKMIYITVLQQKVAKYEQQLKQAELTIRQLNQQINVMKAATEQSLSKLTGASGPTGVTGGFSDLFQQMKNLNKNLRTNNQREIERSLSILRDKYGISGRERFKEIEKLFDRIVEVVMPMHFRVLMENAEDSRKFYSLINQSQEVNSPKLIESQKHAILEMRPQFCTYKKQFTKVFESLSNFIQHLKYHNWVCQGIIDNVQQKMHTTFVAKLLIHLDITRDKEDMGNLYPINQWNLIKLKHKYDPKLINLKLPQIPSEVPNPEQNILNESFMRFDSDNQVFDQIFL